MRKLPAAALATALAGAGCAASAPVENAFTPPTGRDGGVVIAESFMVPGTTTATNVTLGPDDCAGPGLGIKVESPADSGNFLYDKTGEPCEAAQTLFDGRTPLGQRAADPSINLTVFDKTGPLPPEDPARLAPLPNIKVTSELLKPARKTPDVATIEPAAGPSQIVGAAKPQGLPVKVEAKPVPNAAPAQPDPLVATLTTWQRQDDVAAHRMTESDAAAARNIEAISAQRQHQQEQDTMAQLMAKLRERERQVQEEQRRNAETLERAQQNRATTAAAQTAWQQKENELQAELTATQQRLQQFQQLNQRLAAEKAEKEAAYQTKISALSSDLKAAEIQSDDSRRQLVLQAAAKIAEAEQLAHAAQLQEQDARLREAARLKSEAETMMDRALAIKAGQGVVVGGVGAPAAAPMALLETPVVVHANKQTLEQILASILKQVQPQAGAWQADWQLSGAAKQVLDEKWSLTAEAPLQQVLAQLQQQVKAAYGFTLTFTQFNQSRLLVVTDDAKATHQTSEK